MACQLAAPPLHPQAPCCCSTSWSPSPAGLTRCGTHPGTGARMLWFSTHPTTAFHCHAPRWWGVLAGALLLHMLAASHLAASPCPLAALMLPSAPPLHLSPPPPPQVCPVGVLPAGRHRPGELLHLGHVGHRPAQVRLCAAAGQCRDNAELGVPGGGFILCFKAFRQGMPRWRVPVGRCRDRIRLVGCSRLWCQQDACHAVTPLLITAAPQPGGLGHPPVCAWNDPGLAAHCCPAPRPAGRSPCSATQRRARSSWAGGWTCISCSTASWPSQCRCCGSRCAAAAPPPPPFLLLRSSAKQATEGTERTRAHQKACRLHALCDGVHAFVHSSMRPALRSHPYSGFGMAARFMETIAWSHLLRWVRWCPRSINSKQQSCTQPR